MPLLLVRNDITFMETDAVVLPANKFLEEGPGASQSIYEAAGREQLTRQLAFDYPEGCQMGHSVITPGFNLPASHIIHTVCPQWLGGETGEADYLYSAYSSALNLAKANNLDSISFPLLSTGSYAYPRAEALNIANRAIVDFLQENEMEVYLVFFESDSLREGSKLYGHIEALIDDEYVDINNMAQDPSTSFFDWYDQEEDYASSHRELRVSRLAESKHSILNELRCDDSAYVMPNYSLDGDFDKAWSQDVENFNDMLLRFMKEKGKKPSNVYKGGNISKQTFSRIRNNHDMIPTKKTIVGLAMGLELNLEETRQLLEVAGYALSKANKFDVIVSCFFKDNNHNVFALNEFLFDHGLEDQLIGF